MARPDCSRSPICPRFTPHARRRRTARVHSAEQMPKDGIEVVDEIHQFLTQIIHRFERTTADHFPHDHSKDPLDLFRPRTVLGVSTNRTLCLGSEKNAWRAATDFRMPTHPLLPSGPVISQAAATTSTRVSEQWIFKLSATNPTTHTHRSPSYARCGWRNRPRSASGRSTAQSIPRSSARRYRSASTSRGGRPGVRCAPACLR